MIVVGSIYILVSGFWATIIIIIIIVYCPFVCLLPTTNVHHQHHQQHHHHLPSSINGYCWSCHSSFIFPIIFYCCRCCLCKNRRLTCNELVCVCVCVYVCLCLYVLVRYHRKKVHRSVWSFLQWMQSSGW